MTLTYEIIREVKQKEKSEKLQYLPENFFEDVVEYIKLKKGAIEETAAKNLVQSIFELRRKKILNIASLSYKTEKIPENLEENEKRLYLSIIKLLRENFERKTIISSENKSPQNKKEVKKPEEIQNLEDKKTRLTKTRVMFLADIPEIFLPSGNSCSFKKGEEKEIDLTVAKVLEEKGFCRLV